MAASMFPGIFFDVLPPFRRFLSGFSGGIAEQDFHEIEMLLGEIPNVTSGNHLTGITGSSQKLEIASKDTKLYNFHQLGTDQGRNSSNGGVKLQNKLSTGYEFTEEIYIEDTNLQDGRSLPLLLEGMSIKESLSSKPGSPASVLNKQNSLNHTFLPNKQFINHQDEFLHGYDHIDMNYPQSGSLNGVTSSNIELEMRSPSKRINELTSLTDQNESNQTSESLLDNFSEYHQVFQMNTMDMPLDSCSNSYQLLPNGHELQLPNRFQPNYCTDSRSSPMRVTQPSMVWHGLEEERYGRSHQQCLHPQHLHNQRPEFLQFRRSIDCGISPFNGNNVQPCFEFTVPRQFERCKGPFLNANTVYDRSNMINYCHYQSQESSGRVENCWSSHEQKVLSGNSVSCSTKDFHGHQSFDKVGNKCFPQKILTRAHGVNSVRVLRPNTYTTDQPLLFDQTSFRWSNGNTHKHCLLNNGSLQLNNRRNNGSCHANFNSGLASKSLQKRYTSLDEVAGRICLMAKDQHGCRFLQRKFTEGSREEIDKIFSEIILQIVELMTDPFGNYLVQKLLEVCNEEQMMLILKIITRNTNELVRISCDMHGYALLMQLLIVGTRALQKVIETVRTPEQIFIVVSSLEPCIIPVMKHVNGNHVAQRCMQYLSNYSETTFLSLAGVAAMDSTAASSLPARAAVPSPEVRDELWITTIYLSGKQNFVEWVHSVRRVLQTKGLLHHLTRDAPIAPTDE
ncbi:hypothetical protein KSP39_PZI009031 [Platanthera zijinensis]|uniref:PUM-HD domain-containing protein n=1 Tax=Platanthera zijinensis TaxID=2320716 RepID=A0AAP0BK61_9ASPA